MSDVSMRSPMSPSIERIPRYVRVNTTCWSTEQAVKTFISRGYKLSSPFEEKLVTPCSPIPCMSADH